MKQLLLLLVVLSLGFAVGCRPGHGIETVSGHTGTTAQTQLSADAVQKAILAACSQRGWHATNVSPGLIEARIVVRGKHTVVVDIPYTAEKYSIKYKSSSNMEYQADKGKIHPNYNKWVNLLNNDINIQLAKARG